MSYFIDICFICLKHFNNLEFIRTKDTNGTTIEDKLKYCLPEHQINSNIPKYICVKCGHDLNRIYEFKQECLRNMTAYEKYAQQVATVDGSYKYLSVTIRPNFMYEDKISDNYDPNILEFESEKICIKEETNEDLIANVKLESSPRGIKEEILMYNEAGISKEIFDEEKTIKEFKAIPCEIKEESSASDDLCKQTENAQISHKVEYNRNMFECKICNETFEYSSNLIRHLITHTNKQLLFTSEVCNKSLRKPSNLNHEKPFTCEACNKSFRQLKALKQHKLIHTDEKPFSCKICNKSFRDASNLNHHKVVHTGKKPYTCEICNKSFRQSSNLKEHKLLHTGEKPFTCDTCNNSFRQLSTLKKHKLIHTGEKPFTCEICNKSFRQSSNLITHKLVHTGKKLYTCEICNKSFTSKQYSQKHLRIHSK